MTVLDAYAVIQREIPRTAKLPNGRRAHGRSILRLLKQNATVDQLTAVLSKLDEPAKSLIQAELASGRV